MDEIGKTAQSGVDSLDMATDAAATAVASVRDAWETTVADGRATLDRALADAGIANPQELARLQARVAELEEAIARLPQREQRATDLHAERTSHLGRLGEVRRRKSRLVDQAARQLNEALGPRVRLKVYPLADRMGFQEALEDVIRRNHRRNGVLTGRTPLVAKLCESRRYLLRTARPRPSLAHLETWQHPSGGVEDRPSFVASAA